jgi:hypothetical protein
MIHPAWRNDYFCGDLFNFKFYICWDDIYLENGIGKKSLHHPDRRLAHLRNQRNKNKTPKIQILNYKIL